MNLVRLHIDGDEIAYYWSYVSRGHVELIGHIEDTIQKYLERFETDDYKIYLSCPRAQCFRRFIDPKYKAHRDSREPPELLAAARSYLLENHHAISHPRLEADDLIGLACTERGDICHIAVTQDKDAATVPMFWYNPRTDIFTQTAVEQATYNLMKQVLTGDTADGYKGCPGIGPVKATKILGDTSHRGWQKVYRAYLKKGLSRADLKRNYLLAKILRRSI